VIVAVLYISLTKMSPLALHNISYILCSFST